MQRAATCANPRAEDESPVMWRTRAEFARSKAKQTATKVVVAALLSCSVCELRAEDGAPVGTAALESWATVQAERNALVGNVEGPEVTLQQCLELAASNYASVDEARARLKLVTAQLDEARSAPFSDFSSTAGIAVAPTVRGTSIFSPDTDASLSSNMALAWQVGIEGTLPLWTFGKIEGLGAAAKQQVEAKRHELRKVQNEVKLSVRKAYLGVLFARDALALIQEASKTLDKHLDKLTREVEADEGDEVTLFKMRMQRADLEAKASEAKKQETLALAGLRFLIGSKGKVRVPDIPLPPPKHRLAPLWYYLSAARLHRPEVSMAHAGVLAREALLDVERARFYPDVGLTLSGGWSEAPEITDQLNPFVRDPGTYLRYGAALGLRWKLDFVPQAARLAQSQARLDEMRATEEYAVGGVGVEVESAYAEALASQLRLAAYQEAEDNARRWLITIQQGLDIGAYEADEVITPAKEYALQRFNVINARYDYHMALARLALVTGWDAVAPDTL
jgi:outer membrane protein TolC